MLVHEGEADVEVLSNAPTNAAERSMYAVQIREGSSSVHPQSWGCSEHSNAPCLCWHGALSAQSRAGQRGHTVRALLCFMLAVGNWS